MNPVYEKLTKAYECFRSKIDFQPRVALVLGSGLGGFAEEIDVKAKLPYSEIEGFPVSTVPGHVGQFVFGYIDDVPVVLMQGRVHFYEGYDITDVVLPIRLMGLMGAKTLFLTNAAGGIGSQCYPGCLMMLTDHVSFFVRNPLIGANIDELGTRFPDMSEVYDRNLQETLRKTAKEQGIDLLEGVYAQLTGPSYESPMEIQILKNLGVSAVGMSTVVEAIAANHMGMKICGVSCITNLAAGISKTKLNHEEVQKTADEVSIKFRTLVREAIKKM